MSSYRWGFHYYSKDGNYSIGGYSDSTGKKKYWIVGDKVDKSFDTLSTLLEYIKRENIKLPEEFYTNRNMEVTVDGSC